MNIIAFGASNSSASINKTFASYVSEQIEAESRETLDINDYPLPIYGPDEEVKNGIPKNVEAFDNKIQQANLLIISFAEYNGSYTAAFKNLFDWHSRFRLNMFEGKKLILLSASPGPRGGKGVLESALSRFPVHGAEIVGHFSLPKFQENFSLEKGITNPELKSEFEQKILMKFK